MGPPQVPPRARARKVIRSNDANSKTASGQAKAIEEMAWGPEMLKQMLAAFSVKPGTELEEEDAGGAGAGPSGTLDMTGSPAGGAAGGTAATGGDGGRAGNGADGGAIGDSLAGDSLAGDGSPGGTATTGASPAADHSIGRSGGTTHYTTCIAIVGSCLFINSLGERMDVCLLRSFIQAAKHYGVYGVGVYEK